MRRNFAQREVSRNAEIHNRGLTWMHGLEQAAGMPIALHTHLRAHRKIRGMTLERIANAIGRKVNTLSGWETGARIMKLTDLEKLASFYGVHPAALLLAPDEGPRFEAMRQASSIAERMGPDAAQEWLALGERLTAPKPDAPAND